MANGRHISRHLIGVISDTHGLVRPEVCAMLGGVDMIIHAGDVGKPEVFDTLRTLAPVTAVRGNVDRGAWADSLPLTAVIELGATRLFVVHNIAEPGPPADLAGFAAVIYGHSHRPTLDLRESVLFLNPGSAGPRRFSLPITVAILSIEAGTLDATIIDLEAAP